MEIKFQIILNQIQQHLFTKQKHRIIKKNKSSVQGYRRDTTTKFVIF